MKKYLFIATLILISCKPAFAGLNIGTSLIYTKINDPKYSYANEYDQLTKINSISIGNSEKINNFIVTLHTNRLFNKSIKRKVIVSGAAHQNKLKVTYDSLQVGYKYKRFIPSLLIANTKVDKSLYSQNIFLGRQVNHTYMYGLGLGYLLTQKILLSSLYLLPNEEIYMEGGFGLGITYNF